MIRTRYYSFKKCRLEINRPQDSADMEQRQNFEDAIYECYNNLLQKFPNAEAIKRQFGDNAAWREGTEQSPHDEELDIHYKHVEYSGIEIYTMGYNYACEDYFIIILLKKIGRAHV